MKQQRKFARDFSYGGYAIFADETRKPAYLQFIAGKLTWISLARKESESGDYSHSDCIQYDLRKKRDISRLKRKGVVGFTYETPTELAITFQ